jgi:hypothetical protein
MRDGEFSSLESFIQEHSPSKLSAQVVNPTQPDPIQKMAKELFGGMSVDVSEAKHSDEDDDMFVLLDDGTIVASTPMSRIRETLLMVNTDLYRTGHKSLEDVTVPEILRELSETVFSLAGYPESNTEKLVLTLMARYIEKQAWRHETGVIRASFQRLSRLYDEKGTRRVYERLGGLPELDVHAYGAPDQEPPADFPVNIHGINNEELRQSWFVVHSTNDGEDVGMLALEREPNEWDGFWTFDSNEIGALNEYIRHSF